MDNDDKAVLRRIAEGVDALVAAIPKPASRFRRILEIITTAIAIFGILSVVDIVINWAGG